jgi:hypothetical protein
MRVFTLLLYRRDGHRFSAGDVAAARRTRQNRAVSAFGSPAGTVVKRLASTGKISMLQPETA